MQPISILRGSRAEAVLIRGCCLYNLTPFGGFRARTVPGNEFDWGLPVPCYRAGIAIAIRAPVLVWNAFFASTSGADGHEKRREAVVKRRIVYINTLYLLPRECLLLCAQTATPNLSTLSVPGCGPGM